jgi:hypothetical protein
MRVVWSAFSNTYATANLGTVLNGCLQRTKPFLTPNSFQSITPRPNTWHRYLLWSHVDQRSGLQQALCNPLVSMCCGVCQIIAGLYDHLVTELPFCCINTRFKAQAVVTWYRQGAALWLFDWRCLVCFSTSQQGRAVSSRSWFPSTDAPSTLLRSICLWAWGCCGLCLPSSALYRDDSEVTRSIPLSELTIAYGSLADCLPEILGSSVGFARS